MATREHSKQTSGPAAGDKDKRGEAKLGEPAGDPISSLAAALGTKHAPPARRSANPRSIAALQRSAGNRATSSYIARRRGSAPARPATTTTTEADSDSAVHTGASPALAQSSARIAALAGPAFEPQLPSVQREDEPTVQREDEEGEDEVSELEDEEIAGEDGGEGEEEIEGEGEEEIEGEGEEEIEGAPFDVTEINRQRKRQFTAEQELAIKEAIANRQRPHRSAVLAEKRSARRAKRIGHVEARKQSGWAYGRAARANANRQPSFKSQIRKSAARMEMSRRTGRWRARADRLRESGLSGRYTTRAGGGTTRPRSNAFSGGERPSFGRPRSNAFSGGERPSFGRPRSNASNAFSGGERPSFGRPRSNAFSGGPRPELRVGLGHDGHNPLGLGHAGHGVVGGHQGEGATEESAPRMFTPAWARSFGPQGGARAGTFQNWMMQYASR